jgi:hypothetical protein
VPIQSATLQNDTFPSRSGNRGNRVSIDKRSRFERGHPALTRFLVLLVFRGINVLAWMAGGYLVFAGGWFVYSNLPLVCPFIFSNLSAVLSLHPEGAAGIVMALVGLIIFMGIVPPIVIGGIVLPTVKAVISWRDNSAH